LFRGKKRTKERGKNKEIFPKRDKKETGAPPLCKGFAPGGKPEKKGDRFVPQGRKEKGGPRWPPLVFFFGGKNTDFPRLGFYLTGKKGRGGGREGDPGAEPHPKTAYFFKHTMLTPSKSLQALGGGTPQNKDEGPKGWAKTQPPRKGQEN